MILIIDANILFSALIKDSVTAELIFNEDLHLYTCEFIIDEFFKYEKEIMDKTHRTREQFITIMHQLKDIIDVLPEEEYLKYISEARKFSPDLKDAIYFALAIKLNAAVWSNDKRLKKQNRIKVYETRDLMKLV
jgi:predicted nucleic acid-binding protein